MSIVCGKCSYVRGENEHVPDWQCPSCGVAYNKVKKAPPEVSQPAIKQQTEPRQTDTDDTITQDVDNGQKLMIYGVLSSFLAFSIIEAVLSIWIAIGVAIVGFILTIIGILKVLSGVKASMLSKALHVIVYFIPLINLLTLFSVNRKANNFLKDNGYEVGALGPKENFLTAPKFYGILFVAIILSTQIKINKATNPVEIAKSLNTAIKPPVMVGEDLRFEGVNNGRDTFHNKDLLVYKYVLVNYEQSNLSYEMSQILTDNVIKEDVCKIQNLHMNLSGTREKYALRANFYNNSQGLIKQFDFELDDCRAYQK